MITSPSNERIKHIRRLSERKYRQESGQAYLEGLRIVGAALEAHAEIDLMLCAPDLLVSEYGRQVIADARKAGIEILEVSAEVFSRLSLKEGPQGLAAVIRQSYVPLDWITVNPGKPWVALDSIADPGNLGTILRTADASGCEGVILLDQSTDPYDPSAVRGSMGALFSQKIVKATFDQFAAWKKATAVEVIGTSDRAAQDYHATRYPQRMVLLMGSERQGLREHHLELCDQVVSIPMLGDSDSLNLAVATAIVLYEMLNQRREESVA